MSGSWVIGGWDSTDRIFEERAPGNLSESEVLVILQRLACQYLESDEIVSSSLRRNHSGYRNLLARIGSDLPIHVGENPHFSAKRES